MIIESIATTHINEAAPRLVKTNVVEGAANIQTPTKIGVDPNAPIMDGGGGSVIIHAGGNLVREVVSEPPRFPLSPEVQRAVQAAREAAARNEAAKAYRERWRP